MLHLILGDFRTGKTATIDERIRKDTECGIPAKLIVPETETVAAEVRCFSLLPSTAPLTFEVTNFTRLANTVFRTFGGISSREADGAVRAVCMWKALSDCSDTPAARRTATDVARYLSASDELRAAGILPSELADAAERIRGDDRLQARMRELAHVSSAFSETLKGKFSDAAEDSDRLAKVLAEHAVFRDHRIYVDGFTSFTEQEYRILEKICAKGELTVSLCLPRVTDGTLCYEETQDTKNRLCRMAKRANSEMTEDYMDSAPQVPPMTAFVLRTLSVAGKPTGAKPKNDGSFRLVACRDPFAEADYVAADIRQRVIKGARYRDFAVVTGDASLYAGILDAALEKAGIPFFFAEKEDLSAFEVIKLIHSAYTVILQGWRQQDVIGYLKCGLCGIDPDDLDLFELYAEMWDLHGARFQDGDWDMNPDGYTDTLTEDGKARLARILGVKRAMLSPLSAFAAAVSGARTVTEHATALYAFLRALSVPEQLTARAQTEAEAQNPTEAEKYARLFGIVTDALDRLCAVLGNDRRSAEEFHDLLSLLFAHVNIGTIPASFDRVTIGSAETLRAENCRFLYLFGAVEGEFPRMPADDNFFSERERAEMKRCGLAIEPQLAIAASRARFCFLRALAAGREGATVLWHRADAGLTSCLPCSLVSAISGASKKGKIPVQKPPETATNSLFAKGPAADRIGTFSGKPAFDAVLAALKDEPEYRDLDLLLARPIANRDTRISPETVAAIFGKEISLTQSKLEKHLSCPFAFFSQYGLGIRDEAHAELTSNIIGDYVHLLLETFFDLIKTEDRKIGELSDADLARFAEESAGKATGALFPPSARKNARVCHAIFGLKRLSGVLLCEVRDEFAQSRFLPFGQEVTIGAPGNPDKVTFTLQNGGSVRMGGIIDRVDTLQSGDDVYVRVVDYKTGTKDFRRDDIEKGKNLQALLYLMALWQSRDPAFLSAIGCKNRGRILPAGVEYLSMGGSELRVDQPPQPESALTMAKGNMTRTGLVLRDENVLNAMDNGMTGRYLPGNVTGKDLAKTPDKDVFFDPESLGELMDAVADTVCAVGNGIAEGDASSRPAPFRSPFDVSPCRYCPSKPLCRNLKM